MAIKAEQIKELRGITGAGISEVKKALEETSGDMTAAAKIIDQRLGHTAVKKAQRATGVGLVEAYVHSNQRVGALVEFFCETDFVAKNPAFMELAHGVAMHITAMRPLWTDFEDIPKDEWRAEESRITEEVNKMGKPSNIASEIIDGKLKGFFGPMTLMEQSFVKDQDKTVGEIVREAIGRFGENIKVGKFVRFEV